MEEDEREEVYEDAMDRGVVVPGATQAILFSKAMEVVDATEGMLTRDFKVANFNPESLGRVQFQLQIAKMFALHAEQRGLDLKLLIRQIRADAYIVAGTSPSERGKLLELLATMKQEIKKTKIEEKNKKARWVPL